MALALCARLGPSVGVESVTSFADGTAPPGAWSATVAPGDIVEWGRTGREYQRRGNGLVPARGDDEEGEDDDQPQQIEVAPRSTMTPTNFSKSSSLLAK